MDDDDLISTELGYDCPGCGQALTIANAGGYQTFCLLCVRAFPPLPKEGGPWRIEGRFPKFRWTDQPAATPEEENDA